MKTNYFPENLLSIEADAKTVKGSKQGFLTGILYLAPSDLSGVNLCPMARLAECEAPCLFESGRGRFQKTKNARLNKTQYFLEFPDLFLAHLANDIERLVNRAQKETKTPVIRLNGTADMRWENYTIGNYTLFELFPDVQFYDYTKLANRKNIPINYDLTFSYSGAKQFQKYVNQAISNNMRVAVVFDKKENIPADFLGRKVLPGDDSDLRFLDAKNSVVALYAKGPAKQDTGSFVVKTYIPIKLAA